MAHIVLIRASIASNATVSRTLEIIKQQIAQLFSANGCSNIIPPSNAWLKRLDNDIIIIGCYLSQQRWQLKCEDTEWKGLVGTCPESCKLRIVNLIPHKLH